MNRIQENLFKHRKPSRLIQSLVFQEQGRMQTVTIKRDLSEDEFKKKMSAAIISDPEIICELPESQQTEALCRVAILVARSDRIPHILENIVNHSEQLCFDAVKANPFAIKNCDVITERVCKEALLRNPLCFKDIPYYAKTLEVCRFALEQDPICRNYLPADYEYLRNVWTTHSYCIPDFCECLDKHQMQNCLRVRCHSYCLSCFDNLRRSNCFSCPVCNESFLGYA